MDIFDIYLSVMMDEMLVLEEFLVALRDGKYGNFTQDDLRRFRETLERNISESAYTKGEELGMSSEDIERITQENISELRALFEKIFGHF